MDVEILFVVDRKNLRDSGTIIRTELRIKNMISVIVPIYNVEKYLRRCIDSIIAQTYKDLEIILVNDGSADACPQICDEYAEMDSRIIVIHKENGGLSSARNAGLEISKGEFVGFVDSDDFILPEMYEILYRVCIDYNVLIAACGRRVIDEEGKTIRYENHFDQPVLLNAQDAIRSLLMSDNRCDSAVYDKLYRKILFSDIRYPINVHYEDQNVTPRLFYQAGKIFHVGQTLYVYQKRKESITALDFNQHSLDEVKQAELLKQFIDEKYPELKKEARYFIHYKMGFPLCYASKCRNPNMKEYMNEVKEYSRFYFADVIHGAFTLKHKVWFCKNYDVLKWRLWLWR